MALVTEQTAEGAPRAATLANVLGPNSGLQGIAARLLPAGPTRVTQLGDQQVGIPIGKMVNEIRKTAVMAQKQLASDIEAIKKYNAQLEKANEPIVRVLAHFNNQPIRGYRDDWQKWWNNAEGYSYDVPRARPKPTIVESVALAYQPQPVEGYVYDQQVGYVPPPPRPRTSCFGVGTLVRTKLGLRPIETLEVGDQVLAQEPDSGALSFQPVVAIFHNRPTPALRITLGSESIVATGIHRFWRAGQGWVMARELKPGDALRTCQGLAHVESVEPVPAQPVFNLEVAQSSSFFVGNAGALVHDNSQVEPAHDPFDALARSGRASLPSE